MSAVDNWRQMILAEHAQTDRIRGPRPTDHWTQLARNFKDDPHRTGDEMVEELRARIRPRETLIDVGAGGRQGWHCPWRCTAAGSTPSSHRRACARCCGRPLKSPR